MDCFYVNIISWCLLEIAGDAHVVTARDELYFLYKRDSCRSCRVEILCTGSQGRGALDRLDTQIVQPLSSRVVVQGQSDGENSRRKQAHL